MVQINLCVSEPKIMQGYAIKQAAQQKLRLTAASIWITISE